MGHIGLCPPDDASGRKSLSHITPSHHTVRSNGHITSLSDCIYATPGNVANRSTTVTSVSWRPPVAPSGESKPHYMPTALRLWINRLLADIVVQREIRFIFCRFHIQKVKITLKARTLAKQSHKQVMPGTANLAPRSEFRTNSYQNHQAWSLSQSRSTARSSSLKDYQLERSNPYDHVHVSTTSRYKITADKLSNRLRPMSRTSKSVFYNAFSHWNAAFRNALCPSALADRPW